MTVVKRCQKATRGSESSRYGRSPFTLDLGPEVSVRTDTKDNVRLTFEQKVERHFDRVAESNFNPLRRIVGGEQSGRPLMDQLFERFWGMTPEDTS